jgi:hypothetical protein
MPTNWPKAATRTERSCWFPSSRFHQESNATDLNSTGEATGQSPAQSIGSMAVRRNNDKSQNKRWVASVSTDSTHPPEGLLTKSASTIARSLASKRVSPKGPASGLRMINYFINRAGRNLPPERKRVLQEAKSILSRRITAEEEKD